MFNYWRTGPNLSESCSKHSKVGRRPKSEGIARDDLLRAAEILFARQGVESTSLRAIARKANVNPALVLYYFDDKEEILMELVRVKVAPVVAAALGPETTQKDLGVHIVRAFLSIWDEGNNRDLLVALFRYAGQERLPGDFLRQFLFQFISPLVERQFAKEELPARLTMVATQIIGLGAARYVLRLEPFVTADPDFLALVIGMTIERDLSEPLPQFPLQFSRPSSLEMAKNTPNGTEVPK